MVPKNIDVIFSTDMYFEPSFEGKERQLGGSSEKLLIPTVSTKKSADWNKFLLNSENKKQLLHVICEVWGDNSMAKKISGKK